MQNNQTNSTNNAFGQRQEELKNEMKQEVQAYVDTAKNYAEAAGQKVEDLTHRAKGKGEDLLNQAHDHINQAREKVRDASARADAYAHQNPWPLVAGAAVAGLVLGLLCRGCRHRD